MVLPILASVLIVFGSPYVGDIRGAVQSSFPDHYRSIIAIVVAAGAGGALAAAVTVLRRRGPSPAHDGSPCWPPWVQYTLVALAVSIGITYARVVRTGNPDVDLVEALHFVEYGLLTYLFYRAWRQRADVTAVAFPACAGLFVGIADEWIQWLVPGRVGEMHDVWLNAVASGCGLLFSVALHPPLSLALPRDRRSRLALGATVSVVILALAAFFDRVHLGHEISGGQSGTFRSRYDAPALETAAVGRPARWRAAPPPLRGFAREDHYLSEGLWHVQRRNDADSNGDQWTAWNENLILEQYYSPVLDRGTRWPMEQRVEMERRARGPGATRQTYVSSAQPYPIYVAPRWAVWTLTALLVTVIAALCSGRTVAASKRAA